MLDEKMRQPRQTIAGKGCGKKQRKPSSGVGESREQQKRRHAGAGQVQSLGRRSTVLTQIIREERVERPRGFLSDASPSSAGIIARAGLGSTTLPLRRRVFRVIDS